MKVKYVRANAISLNISHRVTDYFDYVHGQTSVSDNEKSYRPRVIGYESTVYALMIKDGHVSYYVKDPNSDEIYHSPSVCFEVLDNRVSQIWHMKHNYVQGPNHPVIGIPSTLFAIREWIEEPAFLNNYVDGRDREVKIMNAAIALMDIEFS